MKGIEVPIKARSTPASLSFKGQTTKHTTVKWSIGYNKTRNDCSLGKSVSFVSLDLSVSLDQSLRHIYLFI